MKSLGSARPWIGLVGVGIALVGMSVFLRDRNFESAPAAPDPEGMVTVKAVAMPEPSSQTSVGKDRVFAGGQATAVAGPESDSAHTHAPVVLREETRYLEPGLAELGRSFETESFREMEFPLFDGQMVRLTSLRHVSTGVDAGVFTGRVAGDAASHVVLSYVGAAESGTIQHPSAKAYFEIRSNADGSSSYLTQVDPESFPPCAACLKGTHAGPL